MRSSTVKTPQEETVELVYLSLRVKLIHSNSQERVESLDVAQEIQPFSLVRNWRLKIICGKFSISQLA